MSHFLFLTWDGGGNVPPAIGIASELRDRGHEARFLGHEGNRAATASADLPFRAFDHALPFTSQVVNGPERMVEIFNDAGVAQDLLIEADREPTDVVVIDPMMLAALAAARESGAPVRPAGSPLLRIPPRRLASRTVRAGRRAAATRRTTPSTPRPSLSSRRCPSSIRPGGPASPATPSTADRWSHALRPGTSPRPHRRCSSA